MLIKTCENTYIYKILLDVRRSEDDWDRAFANTVIEVTIDSPAGCVLFK